MIQKKKLVMTALCGLIVCSATAQPRLTEKNIEQVLKAMTLQEKADLLVGCIDGTNYFGIPQPTGSDPSGKILVAGAAGQTNLVSRLGIPSTVVADGPAGVRILPNRPNDSQTYYCTGFPVGILLASTWDPAIVKAVGQAMGKEVKEYGIDVLLAPGTNIMRSPLCGRNFEYYSEDPLLAGKICAAMIGGIQSQGVGTSVKHFAVNNQETNRNESDSRLSQRALREIYLKPFEIAIKEAQPWTVMSSYNLINGTHAQENYDLLTTILRREWGFKGIVMTDWTGLRNTSAQIHAGNDLMMPGVKAQIEQIVNDVNSGVLKEEDVDECVRRMLQYIVKTPRFKGYPFSNKPDMKANAAVSRLSAAEGIVLLKNEQATLPFDKSIRNIALFGNTSYDFLADGSGSGHVSTAYVVNLLDGLKSAGYQINDSLHQVYSRYMELEDYKFDFSPAAKMPILKVIGIKNRPAEQPMPSYLIRTTATQSDLAIITIGRKPGEGFDRSIEGDFNLTDMEQALIEDVCNEYHAVGKRVVVILNVGGVVETQSWKHKPDAILLTWMPGQEGGNTVADILTGKVNPSGHLPITFPCAISDVPCFEDFPQGTKRVDDGMFGLSALLNPQQRHGVEKNIDFTEYNEDINVGYRYYTTRQKPVSYPFGFGLSYTSFTCSDAKVKNKGDKYEVNVVVKNTGNMAGKQVVQAYVSAPQSSLYKPIRELKAFAKTRLLQPGESQTLTLSFSNYDIASFAEANSAWETEAGTYYVEIGEHADKTLLKIPFTVKKSKKYPVNNVLPKKL